MKNNRNRIAIENSVPWEKETGNEQINFRFNIITVLVYIIGIVLILQLFNLQVVNGESYREQSNTRLSRETSIKSTRGAIMDRTGEELTSVKSTFRIEMYKTNLEDSQLNSSILNLVNLLDQYEISYPDTFPVSIDPYQYTIEGEELEKWKAKYKVPEDGGPEAAINRFKRKYEIEETNLADVRKIIGIRYLITTTGYSTTKSIIIADDVNQEIVAQISERSSEFPGINIEQKTERTYLAGGMAGHVIGYTGRINQEEYNQKKDRYDSDDIIGKTGIEYLFEDYLKGADGDKQVDMSVNGTITGEYITESAVAGSDIVLTIDSDLQRVTESALENCINKIRSGGFGQYYDAQGGAAVVMNVHTGEVLATASYPTYEPQWFVGGISTDKWNELRDSPLHPLINKTTQSAYAPGSIFKMVTAISGLETGAISTKERINDTGVYRKYNEEWKCWYYTSYHRGHGNLNVTQALQHSCNYFFYEVGDRVKVDNMARYALHFGLGKKTGIELPSESAGYVASTETKARLRNGESWYSGETLSAAIGQSYNSFTPMQIAKYISSIANGGNIVKPTIIKTILNSNGTEVPREQIDGFVAEKLQLDLSDDGVEIHPQSIAIAREGMRMATSEAGGTAFNVFKNFGMEVAGKTGSAEAGKDDSGRDKVNAWFVCFAPFDNPEVAVVVMIENGGHGNYSAEVARDVLTQYFGRNEVEEVNESVTAIPYTEERRW